jgi:ring-1,2-phenylacetyl-CoA epoxidase subunit PaaD
MVRESLYQEEEILQRLEVVKDPEIPVLSLVDMGVITQVGYTPEGVLEVNMTPTFVGCPAMDAMRKGVEEVLTEMGIERFEVRITFERPWSSDKITDRGRAALKQFGLAPPPIHGSVIELDMLEHVQCPYCSSDQTVMKSPFGPTLCRSLHYCNHCKQAFEQFKPL